VVKHRRVQGVSLLLSAAGVALLCVSCSAQSSGSAADAAVLQRTVTRTMGGKSGSAVVVDVGTGKVLAAYHPDVAARRLVLPGSAIKPFTLLTLLEANKVTAQTTLMCKRPLTIGGHNLECSHPAVNQPLDPAAALAYSCNSYFTSVATRLTPAELRNNFLKYGFGAPSGLASDEAKGTVALAATQAELQLQAIGEWGVEVTPLELLRGYRYLALLSQQRDAKLEPLFHGLEESVSYGMGHRAQPDAAMKVAGKTGTSLVNEGSWRHGWFAGYAPAGEPTIAVVVFLEKGRGPTDAASVARAVFAAHAGSVRASEATGASH
jgi:cell division protein FtsI/penicillin-binding protein 2